MAKTLISNTEVDGNWYGPDYPENEVTADVLGKVTNPAAFVESQHEFDNRIRTDDGLDPDESVARNAAAALAATGGLDLSGLDVDAMNVEDVEAWVGDDPARARAALAAEGLRQKGARSTLVTRLEGIAGTAG